MSRELSPSVTRERVHHRTLDLQCFQRSDGLLDIEGRITDIKPFDLVVSGGEVRAANTPVHDMLLRLTVNEELEIVSAEAAMPQGAQRFCYAAPADYSALVGVKIGPGWIKVARMRLERGHGCTHITEMLGQMGTAAMQGMYGLRMRGRTLDGVYPASPKLADTCRGLRRGNIPFADEFPPLTR